jgi:hypothetical protein
MARGFGEFRINVFVVVGAALNTVTVVVHRSWETPDLRELGGHLNRGIHNWRKTTALGAVLGIIGSLTLLVPVVAGRHVILLCEMVSVYGQQPISIADWRSYSCEYELVGLITPSDGLR